MQDMSSRKRDRVMSVEAEASELLQGLSGPPILGGGGVKAAIRVAANASGLTFSRARKIWYQEARIWAEEMDQLRARAATVREGRNDAIRIKDASISEQVLTHALELALLCVELEETKRRMASAQTYRADGLDDE